MNRRIALRTVLSTAGVLCVAACQGFTPPRPLGRHGGDGKVLSLSVRSAFGKSAQLTGTSIEVFSTDEDVVVLKGTVENSNQFHEAERIAGLVDGVARVDNALFIRP